MRKPGTPPLITLFGGSGFIGRYVCEALLRAGARLRVAERAPGKAWFLQPLASIGQASAIYADLTRPETLSRAVEGADSVINLVGIFKGKLELVHTHGAGALAAAARTAGARSFVQVSAIGANPESTSEYGRTKGLGEEAVRAAFPEAIIIRPSVVFGPEDDFTNRFASMARFPFLPVIAPRTKFQPIFVGDLSHAIARAALDPRAYRGKTYELGGPQLLTMRQLNEEVAQMAGCDPEIVEVPDFIASAMASLGFLPGAPLSRDQWLMLQDDNVAGTGMPGLKAFGITPTPMSAVAPEWLSRFRRGGRFSPRREYQSAG